NGGTGEADVSDIIAQLDKLEKGEAIGDVSEPTTRIDETVDTANIESLENLDEFQRTILQESLEKGYQNYEISVTLREDCLLKGARVFMAFEILEKLGEVVYSNPPVNELEEENFDFTFTVVCNERR